MQALHPEPVLSLILTLYICALGTCPRHIQNFIPKRGSSKGTFTVTQEQSPLPVMSLTVTVCVGSEAETRTSVSRNKLALGINGHDGGRITTGPRQHRVYPGHFTPFLLQQASLGQI